MSMGDSGKRGICPSRYAERVLAQGRAAEQAGLVRPQFAWGVRRGVIAGEPISRAWRQGRGGVCGAGFAPNSWAIDRTCRVRLPAAAHQLASFPKPHIHERELQHCGDMMHALKARGAMARSDLSDFEWSAIPPLLPTKARSVKRPDDRGF